MDRLQSDKQSILDQRQPGCPKDADLAMVIFHTRLGNFSQLTRTNRRNL